MANSIIQMTHLAALAVLLAVSVYRAYILHQKNLKQRILQNKEGTKKVEYCDRPNLDINLARVKHRCSAVAFNIAGLKKIERMLRLKSLQVNHYNGLVHATCQAALNSGGPGFLLEIVKIAHQHDQKMQKNFLL